MNIKQKGMSLIELLIVMAIVAIIAAVAYPSYQDYMIKARRADGTGAALELAQYMERVYSENGRYDQDRAGNPIAIPAGLLQNPAGNNPHYTFTFDGGNNVPQNATTYSMEITRASVVQQADTRCADLRLNEQGVRCTVSGAHCSDSGAAADVTEVNYCW